MSASTRGAPVVLLLTAAARFCGVLCGVQRAASFVASVRNWLTVADRPAAVAADLWLVLCISYSLNTGGRPCSIMWQRFARSLPVKIPCYYGQPTSLPAPLTQMFPARNAPTSAKQ